MRPPWISSDKSPGSCPFGPHSISSLSSLWPQLPYLESKGPDLGFLGSSIQKDALGEAVGAELPSLSAPGASPSPVLVLFSGNQGVWGNITPAAEPGWSAWLALGSNHK